MMTSTAVLRSFRSDTLRDLARRALDQGWDAYPTGGGHIRMVSPEGRIVEMSMTAAASRRGHDQANVRAEFARAGLDLRSKAEQRREKRALRSQYRGPLSLGEARSAHERTMTMAAPAPMPKADKKAPPKIVAAEHTTKTNRYTARSGARAATNPAVNVWDERIAGQPFRFREHADGKVSVTTLRRRPQRSYGPSKTPMDERREYLAAWVQRVGPWEDAPLTNGSAGHPLPVPQTIADVPDDVEPGAVPDTDKAIVDAFDAALMTPAEPAEPEPTETPPPAPEVPASERVDEGLTRAAEWSVVRVDPSEFPIASTLSALHDSVQPAIAALIAAGKSDAAALLRGELELTPVESELVRLWAEVHAKTAR